MMNSSVACRTVSLHVSSSAIRLPRQRSGCYGKRLSTSPKLESNGQSTSDSLSSTDHQTQSNSAPEKNILATNYEFFSQLISSLIQPKKDQPVKIVPPPENDQRMGSVARIKPKVLPTQPPRSSLRSKTHQLIRSVQSAKSSAAKLLRTEELTRHLIEYPELRAVAVEGGMIRTLMRFENSTRDSALRLKSRQCLSTLGHQDALPSPGIRILSLDGGGTRGMMALQVLGALEEESGKKIHEMFDFVIGCSTGAIIASLLAGLRVPVPKCREIYREMSKKLFAQNKVYGVSGLLWSHSYYDTGAWVSILKQAIGDQYLMETAKLAGSPKLCLVSCIVNKPMLGAFTFRNYHHPPGRESVFPGSVNFRLWQALQASAAAPGYFEEVKLGNWLHQDGGVLVNNPSAVGVHEARLLWPHAPIQCLVSVGMGRHILSVPRQSPDLSMKSSSLKEKIVKIVDSATDTEMTHTTMNDLIPEGSYFRLNPYMSHPYTLDEIDVSKFKQMEEDAQLYIRKNIRKIKDAGEKLNEKKSLWNSVKDRLAYAKEARSLRPKCDRD